MSDLPRPVTVADKYLAALVAQQEQELETLKAILDALATYEPSEDDGSGEVELREVEPKPEPTLIPEDFPGYDALTEAGIVYLETVPRNGDELVQIPGIGKATANKILTWFKT